MPKLNEKSPQGFTPINKESPSISTDLITPVPIHPNQGLSSLIHEGIFKKIFFRR